MNPRIVRRFYQWAILTPQEKHDHVIAAMRVLPSYAPIGGYSKLLKKAGIHYWSIKATALRALDKMYPSWLEEPFEAENPVMARELFDTVRGIGRKTASMMANFTCGGQFAVVDTHVLQWLKDWKFIGKTFHLSEKNYDLAEAAFRDAAKEKGLSVVELDFEIWNGAAKRETELIKTPMGWIMPREDWEAIST